MTMDCSNSLVDSDWVVIRRTCCHDFGQKMMMISSSDLAVSVVVFVVKNDSALSFCIHACSVVTCLFECVFVLSVCQR